MARARLQKVVSFQDVSRGRAMPVASGFGCRSIRFLGQSDGITPIRRGRQPARSFRPAPARCRRGRSCRTRSQRVNSGAGFADRLQRRSAAGSPGMPQMTWVEWNSGSHTTIRPDHPAGIAPAGREALLTAGFGGAFLHRAQSSAAGASLAAAPPGAFLGLGEADPVRSLLGRCRRGGQSHVPGGQDDRQSLDGSRPERPLRPGRSRQRP